MQSHKVSKFKNTQDIWYQSPGFLMGDIRILQNTSKASFQGYYHRAQLVYLVLSQNHSRIGELWRTIHHNLHHSSSSIINHSSSFSFIANHHVESLLQSLGYWSNVVVESEASDSPCLPYSPASKDHPDVYQYT